MYVLTDEKSGDKTTVTGIAELEKHASNHKVTLTGSVDDGGAHKTFTAMKIQHIAASCTIAPQ